jgi:hypothetical protein
MKRHPIIGRDYYAPTALRRMPRHWVLEEAQRDLRWRWWQDGDFWVGAACLVVGLLILAQVFA